MLSLPPAVLIHKLPVVAFGGTDVNMDVSVQEDILALCPFKKTEPLVAPKFEPETVIAEKMGADGGVTDKMVGSVLPG